MDNLFLSFLSASFVFYFKFVHSTITSSCNNVPYPQLCNHFIDTNIFDTQNQSAFRDQNLLEAMNQAIQAHQFISAMDVSSFGQPAKSAWADCLELYEDSIDHINRSIRSNDPTDSQTWLSAAIANHDTCQNGFIDFNLASYLDSLPIVLISNFSKLLSNSLAINKASSLPLQYDNNKGGSARRSLLSHGFPSWVLASDRKVLRSSRGAPGNADIVVAKDGSGHYHTITKAVAASVKLRSGTKRFVIYVKKGVYKENVEINKSIKNLMLIGEGIDATIITGNKNNQDGITTFYTATFGISGNGFIATDMTFENTAGPHNYQAVALRSNSDFSVFYRCSFKGYQDTLYVHSKRQFYRNCDIYGTIDFIFGDAAAVLQNCNIYVRKPLNKQKNTITAQSRSDANANTGIIIHNSRVTAASDLRLLQGLFKTYLGRPWRKYSRTLLLKSNLDGIIDPAGWLPWNGNFGLSTLYYGEYMNTGSGSSTGGRVKWPGYHVITRVAEAEKFTVGNFLAGDSWIPAAGIPFYSGL